MFWKINRIDPEASQETSVRYTADNSESNSSVSIQFDSTTETENIGRPDSCQSETYQGQKHHLLSFRTGLLVILSFVTVGLCINVYYTKIDQRFHSSEFYYFLYVIVIPIYSTIVVCLNDNLRQYSKFVLVKLLNTVFLKYVT